MKLDYKQRVALAAANFVMRLLFPYDEKMSMAWSDFRKAIEAAE